MNEKYFFNQEIQHLKSRLNEKINENYEQELLQKISDLNEEKAIINEKLGKIVPELILEVEKNKE